jgi:RNA polymerase sigma-70 factor (ECF subfamily)
MRLDSSAIRTSMPDIASQGPASPGEGGDAPDVGALFDGHKERLRRAVRLRLDRRLVGVVNSDGVLELVRQEAIRRRGELDGPPAGGPFLWLRQITGEVLARLHRERLGPEARGDISLHRGALPEATSVALAAQLLGRGGDDRAAARAEQKLVLQEALNAMDRLDREVLTLRHFEQLTNDEAAAVLEIAGAQASEAYVRALKRMTAILASIPRLRETS